MEKSRDVIAVLVDNRGETAVKVQQILTAWGCLIKTRLGLHDGVLDQCTTTGLIILEVVGDLDQIEEFCRKLNLIKNVQAKRIRLSLAD